MLSKGDSIKPALREALAHPGPKLVDVTIDRNGYFDQLTAFRG